MDVTQHVENLLTGENIPASTAEWLRQAFTRHIDGESLPTAFNITRDCPHGLRDAIKRRRWRAKLAEGVRLLDTPGTSNWSLAQLLSDEFARQARSHRPPKSAFQRIVNECRQVYSAPSTNADALWREVKKIREKPSK